jgi:CHAT domain-containing protein
MSSCETGITSTQNIVDEYIGLVSGFLSAGVAHVVSTLWTVDEISSALLMIQFHKFLESCPPAKALSEAQKWLRNQTYADLSQWYQSHAVSFVKIGIRNGVEDALTDFAIMARDEEEQHKKPYEDPFYWAGFTVTGKVSGEYQTC